MQLCIAYLGDDGEDLLAPMRRVAPAILDDVVLRPYTEADRIHNDPEHPLPIEHSSVVLEELSDEAIDALLAFGGPDAQCPLLMIEIRHLGGALDRAPSDDAVGLRGAAYTAMFLGVLMPEIADIVPVALAGGCEALAPFSTGQSFVNLHGPVSSEDDRRRPWSGEQVERLVAIKDRLDPDHRFAFGHWD